MEKTEQSYWNTPLWQIVRDDIRPKLKDTVARLRRYNLKNIQEEKRIAEMLRKNPLHWAITFSPPPTAREYWDEEKERISYERMNDRFENQIYS